MIKLIDTFNHTLISKHFTLKYAIKAQRNHLKAIKKRYGNSSYITYALENEDGTENDWELIDEIRMQLDSQ